MAEDRTFPPSPRRRALARRAGLSAASPVLVGAVACAGGLLALYALGRTATERLGTVLAAACRGEAGAAPADLVGMTVALALPIAAGAAIAAVVAHVAQTRSLVLPRRRVEGAPALDAGSRPRVRRAAVELANATVIGVVAFAWLWLVAPRLARLPGVPLAGAALIASALATFAIAWAVLGVLDALVRHTELAAALRMTPREHREDARHAGPDPRFRALRRTLAREPRLAIAGATLLVLGDDVAVAIAWDAHRQPVPRRLATGRGPRATQLLALARRDRLPVFREPPLAGALAATEGDVPEAHWPRLAELVAALQRTA